MSLVAAYSLDPGWADCRSSVEAMKRSSGTSRSTPGVASVGAGLDVLKDRVNVVGDASSLADVSVVAHRLQPPAKAVAATRSRIDVEALFNPVNGAIRHLTAHQPRWAWSYTVLAVTPNTSPYILVGVMASSALFIDTRTPLPSVASKAASKGPPLEPSVMSKR